MKINYEVKESRGSVASDEWVVEGIDHANDGEVHVTIFSGPSAEERAREYAAWKNDEVPVGRFNPTTRRFEELP